MSPFLNTRAGAISVSFFKKEKDGKEYASCCIQRSYKDKNGEWKREQINLFLMTCRPLQAFVLVLTMITARPLKSRFKSRLKKTLLSFNQRGGVFILYYYSNLLR